MITSPEPAGSAESSDHFISDEKTFVFLGDFFKPWHKFRRRYDISGSPLHRLNYDGRNASYRAVFNIMPQEFQAVHVTAGIFHFKHATVTIGVRDKMQTGMRQSPVFLEWVPDKPEDSACLPVKTAPETYDFLLLRV